MIIVVALALVLAWATCPTADAVVNPHYEEHCPSCHLNLPEKGPGGVIDFHFLAVDIDRTCMICHGLECCTIARPHETTHASGIDHWDKKKYGSPKQLPLSDGFITCATCHFWRRSTNPAPTDYKLVRLAAVRTTGVNWAPLCLDCHSDL